MAPTDFDRSSDDYGSLIPPPAARPRQRRMPPIRVPRAPYGDACGPTPAKRSQPRRHEFESLKTKLQSFVLKDSIFKDSKSAASVFKDSILNAQCWAPGFLSTASPTLAFSVKRFTQSSLMTTRKDPPRYGLRTRRPILDRWRVTGLSAKDALTASDRLHGAITARWPGALVRREVFVTAPIGQQLIQGRIELLVDTGRTTAIIDHKSFPERFEQWEAKALQSAPQVARYGEAIETASSLSCEELFIHMPVVGALLRIEKA